MAYALVMSQEIFAAIVRTAERAGADRDTGALPEGSGTHEELLAAGATYAELSPCEHPVPAAPPRYVRLA